MYFYDPTLTAHSKRKYSSFLQLTEPYILYLWAVNLNSMLDKRELEIIELIKKNQKISSKEIFINQFKFAVNTYF